jgi:hypothetical protein
MSTILEQLRSKFKKENDGNGGPNNYYRFWDMPMNESATVRFLPDKNPDNELGFLQEKMTHTLSINGSKKTIPCLRQYGKACPICELSQSFYKKNDKINGKKYWISKQHIAQCIVTRDPIVAAENSSNSTGLFRFIGLGFQITNIIKDAFMSDDLEDVPYGLTGGYDFVIKKTPQGEYPTYSIGTKFKAKPRDLSEEELALYEEHAVDLSTMLPKEPELETIEALLESALTGKSYTEEDDGDSGEDNPLIMKAKKKPATPATPAKIDIAPSESVATDADADDDDAETKAILDRIRSGRTRQRA